jgi:hypothetical protein
MPAPTPFTPDSDYCVYCHKPAAGQCAWCHALVCADCTDLVPGISRDLAVCHRCKHKRHRPGRHLIGWFLIPALILGGLVLTILLLTR